MERVVLIAKTDKILTNGEVYATRIELGDWDSPDNYREISIEEYNKIQEE